MAKWRAPRSAVDRAEPHAEATEQPAAVDAESERAFARTPNEKIVDLSAEESAAVTRWKDRLNRYVDSQGALDALRLRRPTEPPWPAADNPMLGYLYERSHEIARTEGADTAFAWLASNAWFEGAIAERSRFARHLNND